MFVCRKIVTVIDTDDAGLQIDEGEGAAAAISQLQLDNVSSFTELLLSYSVTLHPACKKLSGGMLAWLSGMRCRLAYSPADATATHYLLLQ